MSKIEFVDLSKDSSCESDPIEKLRKSCTVIYSDWRAKLDKIDTDEGIIFSLMGYSFMLAQINNNNISIACKELQDTGVVSSLISAKCRIFADVFIELKRMLSDCEDKHSHNNRARFSCMVLKNILFTVSDVDATLKVSEYIVEELNKMKGKTEGK
jgi:hypothetical protein